MTSLTSLSTGAIPLLISQRPKILARWTSQARQVGPGTFAEVLVLDASRAVGPWRQRRLFPAAGLNTRLFVCGDDVIIGAQRSALPDAFVKIEDGSGLVGKVRIAGKDPAPMLPGAKGIAAEPAP